MSIEQLEPRRLCAVSYNDGVVTITGTVGDDKILMLFLDVGGGTGTSGQGAQDAFTLIFNGAIQSVDVEDVDAVIIKGLEGNDELRHSYTIPCTIHGGSGNDTITGGSVGDLLVGEDGDDQIVGMANGAGHYDKLRPDNDTILGGLGNDILDG